MELRKREGKTQKEKKKNKTGLRMGNVASASSDPYSQHGRPKGVVSSARQNVLFKLKVFKRLRFLEHNLTESSPSFLQFVRATKPLLYLQLHVRDTTNR